MALSGFTDKFTALCILISIAQVYSHWIGQLADGGAPGKIFRPEASVQREEFVFGGSRLCTYRILPAAQKDHMNDQHPTNQP